MYRSHVQWWWSCEAVAVGVNKHGIAQDIDVATREPGRKNIARRRLRMYLDDAARATCAEHGLTFVGYREEPSYDGEGMEYDEYYDEYDI